MAPMSAMIPFFPTHITAMGVLGKSLLAIDHAWPMLTAALNGVSGLLGLLQCEPGREPVREPHVSEPFLNEPIWVNPSEDVCVMGRQPKF